MHRRVVHRPSPCAPTSRARAASQSSKKAVAVGSSTVQYGKPRVKTNSRKSLPPSARWTTLPTACGAFLLPRRVRSGGIGASQSRSPTLKPTTPGLSLPPRYARGTSANSSRRWARTTRRTVSLLAEKWRVRRSDPLSTAPLSVAWHDGPTVARSFRQSLRQALLGQIEHRAHDQVVCAERRSVLLRRFDRASASCGSWKSAACCCV
jgi:hypothetical protein